MISESFHVLTDHMRRPAMLLTVEGRILDLNPAAGRLLGRRPSATGTLLADHVLDDPDRLMAALRGWSVSGTFTSRELTFMSDAGPVTCRAEGLRVARPDEAGTPLILLRCASLPETEREGPSRRALPEVERAHAERATDGASIDLPHGANGHGAGTSLGGRPPPMQIVSNVAGGMAHEFNNLLTVIQPEAEWALEREPDTALAESLGSIKAASERASELVYRHAGGWSADHCDRWIRTRRAVLADAFVATHRVAERDSDRSGGDDDPDALVDPSPLATRGSCHDEGRRRPDGWHDRRLVVSGRRHRVPGRPARRPGSRRRGLTRGRGVADGA